jgi:hypothetical protein
VGSMLKAFGHRERRDITLRIAASVPNKGFAAPVKVRRSTVDMAAPFATLACQCGPRNSSPR